MSKQQRRSTIATRFSRSTAASGLAAALLFVGFAGAAQAQAAIACPERMRTLAATLADPGKIAGFKAILGGDTSSQTWLQDVAVYGGSGNAAVPVKGTARGKREIVWTFDGQTEVTVACVYEAGVQLTRAAGKPRTCTASILRSKGEPTAGGWGMERASFTCR